MGFTCIICTEILDPTIDDIYTTTCGHIFHHICIDKWLQRSNSCPQCRRYTTEEEIIRLYVTSLNTSDIVNNTISSPGSLQIRLNTALTQIKLMDLENKKKEDKMLMEKKKNDVLRSVIQKHESEKVNFESNIRSLKENVKRLEAKVKDFDRSWNIREENKQLKEAILQHERKHQHDKITMKHLNNTNNKLKKQLVDEKRKFEELKTVKETYRKDRIY